MRNRNPLAIAALALLLFLAVCVFLVGVLARAQTRAYVNASTGDPSAKVILKGMVQGAARPPGASGRRIHAAKEL